MMDKRSLSSLMVGRVMDRALMEIKDGDHHLFMRILNRETAYKLTPIAYKVDSKTGCWICLTAAGHPYPQVRFKGKQVKVSRLIFEEFTGIVPGKGQVLHKCDNPECINPSHLYLGTAKDNVRDWMERDKSQHPSQRTPLYKMRKSVTVREYWNSADSQQANIDEENVKDIN